SIRHHPIRGAIFGELSVHAIESERSYGGKRSASRASVPLPTCPSSAPPRHRSLLGSAPRGGGRGRPQAVGHPEGRVSESARRARLAALSATKPPGERGHGGLRKDCR